MERDTIKETIGRRIQAIREERGETQQMLADALGVDRQVVKTWECATRHVKAPDLLALADHYDCTVDYLLGRDENPTRDADLQAMCHYTGLSEAGLQQLWAHNADEDRGGAYVDFLNFILTETTMDEVIGLIYNAVFYRDQHKNLPAYYLIQAAGWANEHQIPEGMALVPAPAAKEYSIDHASFVFREALTGFVEQWNIHDGYFEKLQKEYEEFEAHKKQYEMERKQEAEHGEHR